MSQTVIKVENLSKLYHIGARQAGYRTFRETLVDAAKAPFERFRTMFLPRTSNLAPNSSSNTIWALKDVSFEVKRGEVVGIIGRNGAGKSTLLKILSRITEPTSGRVELKGRVGSLLEVGTGFHPELTGKENVYLYGAILGMDRWEVTRKFDEIVAFAELEKFVDTPVKRYSSGMYMRLAFAVAAHLEPEILLVDEVLAVGDAAFQKKCLGKMGADALSGRTVLFVSHNMQAIQSLCRRVFQLGSGRVEANGDAKTVVSHYLSQIDTRDAEIRWSDNDAPGNNEVKLLAMRVVDQEGFCQAACSSRNSIGIEMDLFIYSLQANLCVGFDLFGNSGEVILRSYQNDSNPNYWPQLGIGRNRLRCHIPPGLLNAGVYQIAARVGIHNLYWIVATEAMIQFEVILDHGESPFWNVLDGKNRPGSIAPIFKWISIHDVC